jgi:hypothetical protein
MLQIERVAEVSGRSQQEIYEFLRDMRNWEKLMPEGKVSKWRAEKDFCFFNLNNMADLELHLQEEDAPHSMRVANPEPKPFPISLKLTVEDGTARLNFEGEMNFFLQTVAEKPLGNLFGIMCDQLARELAQS